jgi:hypothetical protein
MFFAWCPHTQKCYASALYLNKYDTILEIGNGVERDGVIENGVERDGVCL